MGLAAVDLDRVLSDAGDGALAIGGDGRIVTWNGAAERITGYPAREAIGKPCCELFGGHDECGNRLCYRGCHVMTLVKMGEAVRSFDMQTRTKRGQPVWLNISVLAVPAGRANGAATVHLFRDVTATKALFSRLRETPGAPAAPAPVPDAGGALTRRELEVLRLLGNGLNTRSAAERLHVSRATIRNHVQNIFGKLGVHSRLEAVAFAMKHRWL
jgi:PAS domain S-box-containing protein